MQAHRFFRKASGYIDRDLERPVDVKFSDEEIGARLQDFSPPKLRVTTGVLVDWNRTATQFHEGAMLKRTLK